MRAILSAKPAAIPLLACAAALGGCAWLGAGTRTQELDDGKYMVMTPSTWDVASENDAASHDACPDGFTIVKKGTRPDSAYNVTFYDSDYASYWIIQCEAK